MKKYSLKIKVSQIGIIDKLIGFFIILLYANCIFDPKAFLFHLKTSLYIIIIVLFLIRGFLKGKIIVPEGLLKYVLSFAIIIPFMSMLFVLLFYFGKYNSISLIRLAFRTSIFLSLALIFFTVNKSYYKSLAYLLSLLSIVIILVHKYTWLGYGKILFEFGNKYEIFTLAPGYLFDRYIIRIYFWTSPMLLFAIGYFSYQLIYRKRSIILNLSFLILNIIGMFLSGSRVNITVSVFSFFIILFFYMKKNNRIIFASVLISLLLFLLIYNLKKIGLFFGTESDTIKFSMIRDYLNIYTSDVRHFLFGQGLGSETYFPSRNRIMYYTELTYFELFRKYGMVLGIIYFILMFYPILYINRVSLRKKWIIIVYLIYLAMSFFNPFYFSSNGIIILSIVMFEIYQDIDCKMININFYIKNEK